MIPEVASEHIVHDKVEIFPVLERIMHVNEKSGVLMQITSFLSRKEAVAHS